MSYTLTQDNMRNRYPENITTVIVKTHVVPPMIFYNDRNLTTVIFKPFNPVYDRSSIEAAVEAIENRMDRLIPGLYEQLAKFRATYTAAIGDVAFAGCRSLTSITLPPHSLRFIGREAFRSCTSLTSITLPDSLESIGKQAFYDCSSLTSITLPDSLTTIGRDAFEGCSANLLIVWCDQYFNPEEVDVLQNELVRGCNRNVKRKRYDDDDEAGGAKKRFTDTFL